jgi:hypothetical protein
MHLVTKAVSPEVHTISYTDYVTIHFKRQDVQSVPFGITKNRLTIKPNVMHYL